MPEATKVHVAVAVSQQEPAQTLVAQVPAAVKVPVQLAWNPIEHPVPTQQRPVAGQAGVGGQVCPSGNWYRPLLEAQTEEMAIVHVPFGRQQALVTQGFGLHMVASP